MKIKELINLSQPLDMKLIQAQVTVNAHARKEIPSLKNRISYTISFFGWFRKK